MIIFSLFLYFSDTENAYLVTSFPQAWKQLKPVFLLYYFSVRSCLKYYIE